MLSRFHTKGYQLFSGDATMCRNSIFFYFLFMKKMKKKTFKSRIFSKIAEIFSTVKNGLVCSNIWKLIHIASLMFLIK